MNNILLDLLSFGAILSGVLVITSINPVISVLFLISVFINVAGYLILLGVGFIGITYLIIYVGAIAILFLFVIMMLNIKLVELTDAGREYTKNLPLAFIVGSGFFFEILSIAPSNYKQTFFFNIFNTINLFGLDVNYIEAKPLSLKQINISSDILWDNLYRNLNQIETIGIGLYTCYSLWFILSSVILLLAMVGPIVLCLKSQTK